MLQLPIEEYFRYHPPTTEERKAKHDRVNAFSLEMAIALTAPGVQLEDLSVWIEKARDFLTEICEDFTCRKWARHATDAIYGASLKDDYESVMMFTQQYRMFLNQGVTIDDLLAKRK